ncbi:unnamed protein product [Bemisia tabaci]|uniref:Protein sleepless n=1 Tax=Bemisia tabaci TaxID=7038 RepID=A0A9P0AEQ5_BEMTA|nr:PREDICTED: uncharacterized protein LOC109036554 [Bemisia tabaci]CAH0390220.1 unnamed protein product [Bemisia tabaci]
MADSCAYTCILGIFLVAVCFLNQPVEGIKCWQCSTDVDPRCGEPFNHTQFTLTDCDRERTHSAYLQDHAVCRKSIHRINDERVIIRSCSWEPDNKNVEGPCSPSSSPSYIKVEFCETCNTDACNKAPTLRESIIAIVLPVVMVTLLTKFGSNTV